MNYTERTLQPQTHLVDLTKLLAWLSTSTGGGTCRWIPYTESPYWAFVNGDEQAYRDYITKYELGNKQYEDNIKSFYGLLQYAEYTPETFNYITATYFPDKYLGITDGIHRTVALLKENCKYVPAQIKSSLDLPKLMELIGPVLYHGVPFDYKFNTNRKDMKHRVDIIRAEYKLEGSSGYDIGSFIGGISFSLQQLGANMLALESDPLYFATGVKIEAEQKTGVNFGLVDAADYLCYTKLKQDFAIWFSSFHWVLKAIGSDKMKELLRNLSQNVPVLFLEIASPKFDHSGGMQNYGLDSPEKVRDFIFQNSNYNHWEKIGESPAPFNRPIFLVY
jgi:hypothetical protein